MKQAFVCSQMTMKKEISLTRGDGRIRITFVRILFFQFNWYLKHFNGFPSTDERYFAFNIAMNP